MKKQTKIAAVLSAAAFMMMVSGLPVYAASHGYLDHHAIERIVPGNWVDMSYTAFGHKEMQYLIPNWKFDSKKPALVR